MYNGIFNWYEVFMVELKVTRCKKNQSETSITLQEEEVLRILDALEYRLLHQQRQRLRQHGEFDPWIKLDPIAEKLYSIIWPEVALR